MINPGEEYIKVKICNTEVEVPLYINQEKTEEIVKKIEKRMEELTRFYQVTRTQTFALRIAYESLLLLEKEREKIKEREKEIEEQLKLAMKNMDKIITKVKEHIDIQ